MQTAEGHDRALQTARSRLRSADLRDSGMGSISEVWHWLINVPFLGWIAFGLAALFATIFVAYAWSEFRAGANSN